MNRNNAIAYEAMRHDSLRGYQVPETREEWLELASKHRTTLIDIGLGFMQVDVPLLTFDAKHYEGMNVDANKSFRQNYEDALNREDIGTACWILNVIWGHAPDAPTIHGYTGWSLLCDLCSEGGWISALP